MEKTEEMQDLFKRRGVSEEAKKIILENDRSVLREIYDYLNYDYHKEDIENQIETSSKDKLTEKSVRKIAEKLAYEGEEDVSLNYWDNIDLMIDKYGVSAKYELTDETMKIGEHTLHRIRALIDFGDVEEGDLGGFIESEDNLSHEGDCWVGDEATVYDNAKVYGDAQVYDSAVVRGNTEVYDYAEVYGDAEVHGNAKVCGSAEVFDEAEVYGRAIIFGDAEICGEARVNERVSDGRMEGKEDFDPLW